MKSKPHLSYWSLWSNIPACSLCQAEYGWMQFYWPIRIIIFTRSNVLLFCLRSSTHQDIFSLFWKISQSRHTARCNKIIGQKYFLLMINISLTTWHYHPGSLHGKYSDRLIWPKFFYIYTASKTWPPFRNDKCYQSLGFYFSAAALVRCKIDDPTLELRETMDPNPQRTDQSN